uniref:Uncharacterized protein n=1 Tax=Peromyscus maniculatus bairdii TaxID=230844 RepID=A0A8C8UHV1_PERMB
MTTSCRLRRRSTAARSAARSVFSRAESPYTAASGLTSTEASSTTCTVWPSLTSARRSSSVRWLLPVDGSPQNTTSGMFSGAAHVRTLRQLPARAGSEARTSCLPPPHTRGYKHLFLWKRER